MRCEASCARSWACVKSQATKSPHMLPFAAIFSTNQDNAIARFQKLARERSTNATCTPCNYNTMALAVHVSPLLDLS